MARADRRTAAALRRIGAELRLARRIAGLTLAQVAPAVGISDTELSRIELGEAPWASIHIVGRVAAAVGIDLWLRTYPGGEPVRDIAHLRLADAFRPLLGPGLIERSEVPIGDGRDLRAWDMTLTDQSRATCGVEFETRFLDAQDQVRRLHRKVADGGVDQILLVLADTRANRAAVRAAAALLAGSFAIDDPEAIKALGLGRIPPRNALIFVKTSRGGRPVRSRSTG